MFSSWEVKISIYDYKSDCFVYYRSIFVPSLGKIIEQIKHQCNSSCSDSFGSRISTSSFNCLDNTVSVIAHLHNLRLSHPNIDQIREWNQFFSKWYIWCIPRIIKRQTHFHENIQSAWIYHYRVEILAFNHWI